MSALSQAFEPRYVTLTLTTLAFALLLGVVATTGELEWWSGLGLIVTGGLAALGWRDLTQDRHAVLRNYPVAAHLRFLLESIRPEMRQYFFEGDKDGMPFPRDKRAIVYQRAKRDPRQAALRHPVRRL
jgi:hypothetical protein